jgi:hypothetical protein
VDLRYGTVAVLALGRVMLCWSAAALAVVGLAHVVTRCVELSESVHLFDPLLTNAVVAQ